MIKALRFADERDKITKEYEKKIGTKKTKVMKMSRPEREEKNTKITIDGVDIEQITEFCYFGSLISDDAKCKKIGGAAWAAKHIFS